LKETVFNHQLKFFFLVPYVHETIEQ